MARNKHQDKFPAGSMSKSTSLAVISVFIVAFALGFLSNDFLKSQDFFSVDNKFIETSPANEGDATVNVVAVTEDGTGIIGKANIELVSGRGRTLINTNPFIEPDTQFSADTAISYAVNYTKKDIRNYDIIVSFKVTDLGGKEINSSGQIIGGPSAGAALTVATIAVLEGREVRQDIAITGTVESDGQVGKVGSVLEKAEAAGKAGIKTFLVPKGQTVITNYEKVSTLEKSGPFTIRKVKYVPTTISLNNYTMENWNMSVIEVSRVEDALKYAVE